MDEIDYTFSDTALDDFLNLDNFLNRFGDKDPNRKIKETENRSKNAVKTSAELENEKNKNLINRDAINKDFPIVPRSGVSGDAPGTEHGKGLVNYGWGGGNDAPGTGDESNGESNIFSGAFVNENFSKGMDAGEVAKGGVSALMGGATHGIKLIDNIGGGQFDTSAEGGGPGKAGGAIASGAATGAQFMSGIGFKDPISQAAGAVAGGLISTFAHTGAVKKYTKNRKRFNLSENALDNAKSQEEYARSQGLASMEDLKNLRQKQLGIINT